MPTRASISIFKNSVDYDEDLAQPFVPESVFEAAKRVIQSKGCELIKARDGLYIVKYSETGPFPQKMRDEAWLPVYVARVQQWSSGGIRQSEFQNFIDQPEAEK